MSHQGGLQTKLSFAGGVADVFHWRIVGKPGRRRGCRDAAKTLSKAVNAYGERTQMVIKLLGLLIGSSMCITELDSCVWSSPTLLAVPSSIWSLHEMG